MTKEDFIGKLLVSVRIADDKKALLFEVGEKGSRKLENLVVKVDGDCCSDSWIEHVSLPARGMGGEVFSIENKDLHTVPKDFGDVISVYSCEIKTSRGSFEVEYRNESNGYYGGNLSWPWDKYFYGGVYGQNKSTMNWVEVDEH